MLSLSLKWEKMEKEDDETYYETTKLKQLRVVGAKKEIKTIRFDVLFQEEVE